MIYNPDMTSSDEWRSVVQDSHKVKPFTHFVTLNTRYRTNYKRLGDDSYKMLDCILRWFGAVTPTRSPYFISFPEINRDFSNGTGLLHFHLLCGISKNKIIRNRFNRLADKVWKSQCHNSNVIGSETHISPYNHSHFMRADYRNLYPLKHNPNGVGIFASGYGNSGRRNHYDQTVIGE